MDAVALVYVGGVTVLFFFWVYGIVSFLLDVKHKLLPAVREHRRQNKQDGDEAAAAAEREEQRRGLL